MRLAFMYIMVLREMALCCGDEEKKQLQQQAADMLREARQSWNGAWFGRYREEHTDEMDVVTQCLAALAGVPIRQAGMALKKAYECYMQNPGESDAFTAVLLIGALIAMDEEEKGWQVFRVLMPDQDTLARENGKVLCDHAPMCYAALLFFLLGVEKRRERMTLRPAISSMPEKEVTVVYRHGEGVYHLTCTNTCFITTLDGKRQEDRYIALSPEKGTHEARFPLWKVW